MPDETTAGLDMPVEPFLGHRSKGPIAGQCPDDIYWFLSPMPREKPLLKIKINAPGMKPGTIPIPLLLKICGEAQAAINAAVAEGQKNKKPAKGKKAQASVSDVATDYTLELIALKRGSTTLDFAAASNQLSLPGVAGGPEAVAAVVAPFCVDVEVVTETFWAALHGLTELERVGRIRPSTRDERIKLVVHAISSRKPIK